MIARKGKKVLSAAPAGAVFWLLSGLIAAAGLCPSQPVQPPTDPLQTVLDHFYNLEFDAAEQGLDARLKDHPDDLRALSYLARVDLQREMMRRELLEAQVYGKDGEALRQNKPPVNALLRQQIFGILNKLEQTAQVRLGRNPQDEDALYWLGAAHVTRAIYYLTLEKSNMQALGEAKEAQKDHARLLKLDPKCADAYLVIGTYDYVAGSLPWYSKIVAALIGCHGDRERGLEELERAAEQGHWARTDAETFLSILYYREKRYADAIRILEKLERAYPRNFLLPQEIARAYKAQGDWRSAAREYDALLGKYESHAPGFAPSPAAKVYYQAGETYAHLGEKNDALRRFQKAAELEENNIYVYRAELAAAGIELQENRTAEARTRYQRVARAVPNTGEGRTAAHALKNHPPSPGARGEDAR
jgi:tetratricopeptide (TPR) repeat protein